VPGRGRVRTRHTPRMALTMVGGGLGRKLCGVCVVAMSTATVHHGVAQLWRHGWALAHRTAHPAHPFRALRPPIALIASHHSIPHPPSPALGCHYVVAFWVQGCSVIILASWTEPLLHRVAISPPSPLLHPPPIPNTPRAYYCTTPCVSQ
jgi:hypothetical protein